MGQLEFEARTEKNAPQAKFLQIFLKIDVNSSIFENPEENNPQNR